MKPLVCELCSGNEFEWKDGFFVCRFCGTKYTSDGFFKDMAAKEKLLANAQTFLKLGQFDKALRIFRKVADLYPDDYRGWYGIADVLSQHFTLVDLEDKAFRDIVSYMEKALKTADDCFDEVKAVWDDYLKRHDEFISSMKQKKNELDRQKEEIEKEIEVFAQKEKPLVCEISETNEKMTKNAYDSAGSIVAGFIAAIITAAAFIIALFTWIFGIPSYAVFLIISLIGFLGIIIIVVAGIITNSKSNAKMKTYRADLILKNKELESLRGKTSELKMKAFQIKKETEELVSKYHLTD